MSNTQEKDYELAFEIILHAGESRAKASEAIEAAANYEFDRVDQLIEEAKEAFIKCHGLQTEMLNKEATGQKNDVNIILVHAQDHLTMANVTIENAKHIKKLYQAIYQLKEEK